MALASSLQGGASSVSHHVGIAYGLEHFRIFCFVSRPFGNKNLKNGGVLCSANLFLLGRFVGFLF